MIDLLLAMIFGVVLGTLYFGGLWWTVKKAVCAMRPASWFIVSLLLRLGITLSGFYFVAGDDWKKLLACLLGFIAARAIVIRLTGKEPFSPTSDEATSQSTKLASGQAAGYLPHAGERDAVTLRDLCIREADHAP